MKKIILVLKRDGFELDPPLFKCIIAELDSKIVGYAITYNGYSTYVGKTLYLENIYVQAQHRKKNIGKQLFLTVAKVIIINFFAHSF